MSNKVAKIGRYWTRTCANCGKEIPNWFLKCPVCKAILGEQLEESVGKQTTRIFAQVVAEGIAPVEANLIYTPDQGNNWFRLPMVREEDYFAADIPPMVQKTVIAYFLETTDVNGRKYIEDNSGQYYFFEVRGEEISQGELKAEEFIPFMEQGQSMEHAMQSHSDAEKVPDFFTNPQKPTLKRCQCGTVLKEGWIVCPVCGKTIV